MKGCQKASDGLQAIEPGYSKRHHRDQRRPFRRFIEMQELKLLGIAERKEVVSPVSVKATRRVRA